MAKIDAMLGMMKEKNVERAILRSDKPYQVFAGGQSIEGSVTPHGPLRQMLQEIAPPSLIKDINGVFDCHFQHTSPFGAFDVGVSNDIGALKLTLTPAKAAVPPVSATIPTATSRPSLPATIVPSPTWPQNPPLPPHSPPPQVFNNPSYPPPTSPPPAYPPPPHPPAVYPPPSYPAPIYQASVYPQYNRTSSRSRALAGLMAFLMPGLGVHRFYLGYTGAGIAYLLLTLVFSWITCGISAGIAGVWGIIEGIVILCGGMNDVEGRPLN